MIRFHLHSHDPDVMQTSVKMKLLCTQVAKDLLGQGIDVSLSSTLLRYGQIGSGVMREWRVGRYSNMMHDACTQNLIP